MHAFPFGLAGAKIAIISEIPTTSQWKICWPERFPSSCPLLRTRCCIPPLLSVILPFLRTCINSVRSSSKRCCFEDKSINSVRSSSKRCCFEDGWIGRGMCRTLDSSVEAVLESYTDMVGISRHRHDGCNAVFMCHETCQTCSAFFQHHCTLKRSKDCTAVP